MKKLLFVLVIVAGTAFSASAQSGLTGHFSIGFNGGFPVGSSSDLNSVVLGGNLKYEQPIASATYFTISGGYSAVKRRDDFGGGSSGFVPLKAGLKYYFNGQGFYGEGQLGAAISTESGGGTAFAYSPGIGYTIDGGFDLGVRYEGWSRSGGTFSQIGFRVGYNF